MVAILEKMKVFFGIMHSILPGVLTGDDLGRIVLRMVSEIGSGIIAGYYFIYLLEKSNSLFTPIFVHAILDYSIGGIGIITAIGAGIYLFIIDRNRTKQLLH
jgi:membrane protease YdiL (CAAX protease family)